MRTLFILISLTLFSCSSQIERQIKPFAKDIIEHPEILDKLEYYYPQLINEQYLLKQMRDTNFLNETKKTLVRYFNRESHCLSVYYDSSFRGEYFKRFRIQNDDGIIYNFHFEKKGLVFVLYFLRKEQNIYLIKLACTINREERFKYIQMKTDDIPD